MTSFVFTWNAAFLATPADTDNRSQGALQIRNTRNALNERIKIDHSWAGDANDGYHLAATMFPTTAWANTGGAVSGAGQLYSQNAVSGAGITEGELFWISDRGLSTQLTQTGIRQGPVPGQIVLFGHGAGTAGWIECGGSSVLVSDYPSLFAAITYNYGGGGSSFNVPNLPSPDGGATFYWIYTGRT